MSTGARRGPAVLAAAAVAVSLVMVLVAGAWLVLRGGERRLDVPKSREESVATTGPDGSSLPVAPLAAKVAAKRESESDAGSNPTADDMIQVQIVDAHDKPLPGLIATIGPRGEELSDSSLRATAEGETAIATIRGVRQAARARLADVAEWGASVLVPSRVPPFVLIDPWHLPAEPVVVRLPPCGRLELSFVGRDGRPLFRRIGVRLLAIPQVDGAPSAADGDVYERSFVVEDGLLELPCVECGLRFDVKYEFERLRSAPPRFDGPVAEGEKVSRDFTCDFGPISFEGSIVGGDLRPIDHRRLTLRVTGMRGLNDGAFEVPFVGEGESDDAGSFHVTVAVAGASSRLGDTTTAYDCELEVQSPTGPNQKLTAVATIRGTWPGADLGRLRLFEH